jgi:hypothetical protein
MYLYAVVALLFVLPVLCTLFEIMLGTSDIIATAGKWLVFWAAGVRLFIAGVKQSTQPGFTAQSIFGLDDERSYPFVREIGFGNLSIGTLGILSLAMPSWIVPAALVGGLYYLLAGYGHLGREHRNSLEQTALITDFLAGGLLLAFVAASLLR